MSDLIRTRPDGHRCTMNCAPWGLDPCEDCLPPITETQPMTNPQAPLSRDLTPAEMEELYNDLHSAVYADPTLNAVECNRLMSMVKDIIAQARSPAVERIDREAVARIIEPRVWSFHDECAEDGVNPGVENKQRVAESLAKADQINAIAILYLEGGSTTSELTPAMIEAGCRAMHDAQGTGDADAPLHSPYQSSDDVPDSVRWKQWIETVTEVHAAILAKGGAVSSQPSGAGA